MKKRKLDAISNENLRRRSVVLLVLFWLFFTVITWFGLQTALTFESSFVSWLPRGSVERIVYEEMSDAFGSDETLIVSWPDCHVESSELVSIEDEVSSEGRWFNAIASGSSVDQILGDQLKLSPKTRDQRISGFLSVGDDKRTMLVAKLSDLGIRHREQVIQYVTGILLDRSIPEADIHFGGAAYFLSAVDQESFWSPLRIVPAISIASLLLCWTFLGQFRIAFFINQLGLLTGTASLTIVYFSGLPLNMIVWTLPTLIMLLTSSTALHFLAYYRDSIGEYDETQAPREALKKFFRPAALCCLTSCVGLSSLMFSTLAPIFQFGMFGAISVCFSAVAVAVWLPAWLTVFPYRQRGQKTIATNVKHDRWNILGSSCARLRWPIILSTVALLGYSMILLPSLSVGSTASFLFSQSSRYFQDQNWLGENLDVHPTTDVKLTFNNASADNDLDRMRWLLKLQYEIRGWPEVSGVYSAGTFSISLKSKRDSIGDRFKRRIVEKKIQKLKATLIDAGLVSEKNTAGTESWLLSVKTSNDSQYSELSEKLSNHISSQFAQLNDRYFEDEKLQISSSNFEVLTHYIEQRFQRELVLTYCSALCVICLIFLVVFRSWRLLLVSLIPNLLPALAVLGTVAFFQLRLDVGSLITASVALGIAVDDTLHFLLWWKEKKDQGLDTSGATTDALRHCGLAMLQTTVVFGVGVSLYGLSDFLPTMRFGLLLASMMFFAIIGDLILLPALLATRLGRSERS